MTVLLNPFAKPEKWLSALQARLPDHPVELWPDISDSDAVVYAVIGKHPVEDLHRYANLRAVLTLTAGVEHLDLAAMPEVPIVRLEDRNMSNEMAAYALHWVVHFQKRLDAYREQQSASIWEVVRYTPAHRFDVGILGFGRIGRHVGHRFAELGYRVHGWSRTAHPRAWATAYAGTSQLEEFLATVDAVVNLLPSTTETKHLMNADRFGAMRSGSIYISMGRGATTDQEALAAAVGNGPLAAAVLDVTTPEPLPSDSPLWRQPRVHITPHVAGYTKISTATAEVAGNILRIERGERPDPLVDRARGY